MGYATTDDGYRLYFETTGTGEPLVFVHEFAGDHRSWEPQLRYFGRRYQCVAFNARGYPPSDVPEDESNYSQAQAWRDILAIIDHFDFDQAHVIGLSMGGFATLHLGLNRPDRTRSLIVAGCGYGAQKEQLQQFRQEAEAAAASMNEPTLQTFANTYSVGSTRVQFQSKDPRGWEEFRNQLAEHSATGSALTMRGVQKKRPSLYDLEEEMRRLKVPTLIMTGDEDKPCLLPSLLMKRTILSSALVVLPNSGHTINLEEPEAFNQAVDEFLSQVLAGRWPLREGWQEEGGPILGLTKDDS